MHVGLRVAIVSVTNQLNRRQSCIYKPPIATSLHCFSRRSHGNRFTTELGLKSTILTHGLLNRLIRWLFSYQTSSVVHNRDLVEAKDMEKNTKLVFNESWTTSTRRRDNIPAVSLSMPLTDSMRKRAIYNINFSYPARVP